MSIWHLQDSQEGTLVCGRKIDVSLCGAEGGAGEVTWRRVTVQTRGVPRTVSQSVHLFRVTCRTHDTVRTPSQE